MPGPRVNRRPTASGAVGENCSRLYSSRLSDAECAAGDSDCAGYRAHARSAGRCRWRGRAGAAVLRRGASEWGRGASRQVCVCPGARARQVQGREPGVGSVGRVEARAGEGLSGCKGAGGGGRAQGAGNDARARRSLGAGAGARAWVGEGAPFRDTGPVSSGAGGRGPRHPMQCGPRAWSQCPPRPSVCRPCAALAGGWWEDEGHS